MTAFFTFLVFTATNTSWGQVVNPVNLSSGPTASEFQLDRIRLPSELGRIESQRKGRENSPLIVFIQDAHAIFDAQTNIRKIIRYLNGRYGINLVAVEGGEGDFDTTLLRAFPDEKLKKKVFNQYLSRGELSGSEMAALLDEESVEYHGIENWRLYEENYLAYLAAMGERDLILGKLKTLKNEFDREREQIYTPKLSTFHKHVEAFEEEKSNLLDLLKYLSGITKPAGASMDLTKYPHLANLFSYLEKESSLPKESVEMSVRRLAASFLKKYAAKLNRKDAMDFNAAHQAFLSGQIEAGAFLKTLIAISKTLGLKPKLTASMNELLGQAEMLSSIRGTKLFDELQAFIRQTESRLVTKPEERALAEKYRRIRLLKDFANLEITREDLENYQKNAESFLALLDQEQNRLAPALEFYRLALERDRIFHENLKSLLRQKNKKAAVVLAGGFHTRGFEKELADESYSLLVIAPKMNSLAGKELYSGLMQGKLSYKEYLQTTFYDAFVRHASKTLVAGLNQEDFKKNMKLWRDEVIRKLAQQGRVGEAGGYTRYIDLLFKIYLERFSDDLPPVSKEDVLKVVEKEIDRFTDETVDNLWEKQPPSGLAQIGLVSNIIRGNPSVGSKVRGALSGLRPRIETVPAIPVSLGERSVPATPTTLYDEEILAELKQIPLAAEGGVQAEEAFLNWMAAKYPSLSRDKLLELAKRAVLGREIAASSTNRAEVRVNQDGIAPRPSWLDETAPKQAGIAPRPAWLDENAPAASDQTKKKDGIAPTPDWLKEESKPNKEGIAPRPSWLDNTDTSRAETRSETPGMQDEVLLKNGTRVKRVEAEAAYRALFGLAFGVKADPFLLQRLWDQAQNPDASFEGSEAKRKRLRSDFLIQDDSRISEPVRNVILSSLELDDVTGMLAVNPPYGTPRAEVRDSTSQTRQEKINELVRIITEYEGIKELHARSKEIDEQFDMESDMLDLAISYQSDALSFSKELVRQRLKEMGISEEEINDEVVAELVRGLVEIDLKKNSPTAKKEGMGFNFNPRKAQQELFDRLTYDGNYQFSNFMKSALSSKVLKGKNKEEIANIIIAVVIGVLQDTEKEILQALKPPQTPPSQAPVAQAPPASAPVAQAQNPPTSAPPEDPVAREVSDLLRQVEEAIEKANQALAAGNIAAAEKFQLETIEKSLLALKTSNDMNDLTPYQEKDAEIAPSVSKLNEDIKAAKTAAQPVAFRDTGASQPVDTNAPVAPAPQPQEPAAFRSPYKFLVQTRPESLGLTKEELTVVLKQSRALNQAFKEAGVVPDQPVTVHLSKVGDEIVFKIVGFTVPNQAGEREERNFEMGLPSGREGKVEVTVKPYKELDKIWAALKSYQTKEGDKGIRALFAKAGKSIRRNGVVRYENVRDVQGWRVIDLYVENEPDASIRVAVSKETGEVAPFGDISGFESLGKSGFNWNSESYQAAFYRPEKTTKENQSPAPQENLGASTDIRLNGRAEEAEAPPQSKTSVDLRAIAATEKGKRKEMLRTYLETLLKKREKAKQDDKDNENELTRAVSLVGTFVKMDRFGLLASLDAEARGLIEKLNETCSSCLALLRDQNMNEQVQLIERVLQKVGIPTLMPFTENEVQAFGHVDSSEDPSPLLLNPEQLERPTPKQVEAFVHAFFRRRFWVSISAPEAVQRKFSKVKEKVAAIFLRWAEKGLLETHAISPTEAMRGDILLGRNAYGKLVLSGFVTRPSPSQQGLMLQDGEGVAEISVAVNPTVGLLRLPSVQSEERATPTPVDVNPANSLASEKTFLKNLGNKDQPVAVARAEVRDHTAIDQKTPFPDPVLTLEHPWNSSDEFGLNPGGSYSHLYRHAHQIEEFRSRILPQIVERKLKAGARSLRIVVVGPAMGEEMATILGTLIQVFNDHPQWGAIENWQVSVEGIEKDEQIAQETRRRLISGESPLTLDQKYQERMPGYSEKVSEIMEGLNRDPKWTRTRFQVRVGDASQTDMVETLNGSDAIFMNATLSALTSREGREMAALLKLKAKDAFLIGTSSKEGAPVRFMSSTHLLAERPPTLSFGVLELPYTVAVPEWIKENWQTPQLRRAEVRVGDRKVSGFAFSYAQTRKQVRPSQTKRREKQILSGEYQTSRSSSSLGGFEGQITQATEKIIPNASPPTSLNSQGTSRGRRTVRYKTPDRMPPQENNALEIESLRYGSNMGGSLQQQIDPVNINNEIKFDEKLINVRAEVRDAPKDNHNEEVKNYLQENRRDPLQLGGESVLLPDGTPGPAWSYDSLERQIGNLRVVVRELGGRKLKRLQFIVAPSKEEDSIPTVPAMPVGEVQTNQPRERFKTRFEEEGSLTPESIATKQGYEAWAKRILNVISVQRKENFKKILDQFGLQLFDRKNNFAFRLSDKENIENLATVLNRLAEALGKKDESFGEDDAQRLKNFYQVLTFLVPGRRNPESRLLKLTLQKLSGAPIEQALPMIAEAIIKYGVSLEKPGDARFKEAFEKSDRLLKTRSENAAENNIPPRLSHKEAEDFLRGYEGLKRIREEERIKAERELTDELKVLDKSQVEEKKKEKIRATLTKITNERIRRIEELSNLFKPKTGFSLPLIEQPSNDAAARKPGNDNELDLEVTPAEQVGKDDLFDAAQDDLSKLDASLDPSLALPSTYSDTPIADEGRDTLREPPQKPIINRRQDDSSARDEPDLNTDDFDLGLNAPQGSEPLIERNKKPSNPFVEEGSEEEPVFQRGDFLRGKRDALETVKRARELRQSVIKRIEAGNHTSASEIIDVMNRPSDKQRKLVQPGPGIDWAALDARDFYDAALAGRDLWLMAVSLTKTGKISDSEIAFSGLERLYNDLQDKNLLRYLEKEQAGPLNNRRPQPGQIFIGWQGSGRIFKSRRQYFIFHVTEVKNGQVHGYYYEQPQPGKPASIEYREDFKLGHFKKEAKFGNSVTAQLAPSPKPTLTRAEVRSDSNLEDGLERVPIDEDALNQALESNSEQDTPAPSKTIPEINTQFTLEELKNLFKSIYGTWQKPWERQRYLNLMQGLFGGKSKYQSSLSDFSRILKIAMSSFEDNPNAQKKILRTFLFYPPAHPSGNFQRILKNLEKELGKGDAFDAKMWDRAVLSALLDEAKKYDAEPFFSDNPLPYQKDAKRIQEFIEGAEKVVNGRRYGMPRIKAGWILKQLAEPSLRWSNLSMDDDKKRETDRQEKLQSIVSELETRATERVEKDIKSGKLPAPKPASDPIFNFDDEDLDIDLSPAPQKPTSPKKPSMPSKPSLDLLEDSSPFKDEEYAIGNEEDFPKGLEDPSSSSSDFGSGLALEGPIPGVDDFDDDLGGKEAMPPGVDRVEPASARLWDDASGDESRYQASILILKDGRVVTEFTFRTREGKEEKFYVEGRTTGIGNEDVSSSKRGKKVYDFSTYNSNGSELLGELLIVLDDEGNFIEKLEGGENILLPEQVFGPKSARAEARLQTLTIKEALRYYQRLRENPKDAESARAQLNRLSEQEKFELIVQAAIGRAPSRAELRLLQEKGIFSGAQIGVRRIAEFPGLERLKKIYLPNVWVGYVEIPDQALNYLRANGHLSPSANGVHNMPGLLPDYLRGEEPNYFSRLGSFVYRGEGNYDFREPLHETVHHFAMGDQGRGKNPFVDRPAWQVILFEELAAYRRMNLELNGTMAQSFTPEQRSNVLSYVEDTLNLIASIENLSPVERDTLRTELIAIVNQTMDSIEILDRNLPAMDISDILSRARSFEEIIALARAEVRSPGTLLEAFRPGFTKEEINQFRREGFKPGRWLKTPEGRTYRPGDGRALAVGLLNREASERRYVDILLRRNDDDISAAALQWAEPRIRYLLRQGGPTELNLLRQWRSSDDPILAQATKQILARQTVRAEVRKVMDDSSYMVAFNRFYNHPLSGKVRQAQDKNGKTVFRSAGTKLPENSSNKMEEEIQKLFVKKQSLPLKFNEILRQIIAYVEHLEDSKDANLAIYLRRLNVLIYALHHNMHLYGRPAPKVKVKFSARNKVLASRALRNLLDRIQARLSEIEKPKRKPNLLKRIGSELSDVSKTSSAAEMIFGISGVLIAVAGFALLFMAGPLIGLVTLAAGAAIAVVPLSISAVLKDVSPGQRGLAISGLGTGIAFAAMVVGFIGFWPFIYLSLGSIVLGILFGRFPIGQISEDETVTPSAPMLNDAKTEGFFKQFTSTLSGAIASLGLATSLIGVELLFTGFFGIPALVGLGFLVATSGAGIVLATAIVSSLIPEKVPSSRGTKSKKSSRAEVRSKEDKSSKTERLAAKAPVPSYEKSQTNEFTLGTAPPGLRQFGSFLSYWATRPFLRSSNARSLSMQPGDNVTIAYQVKPGVRGPLAKVIEITRREKDFRILVDGESVPTLNDTKLSPAQIRFDSKNSQLRIINNSLQESAYARFTPAAARPAEVEKPEMSDEEFQTLLETVNKELPAPDQLSDVVVNDLIKKLQPAYTGYSLLQKISLSKFLTDTLEFYPNLLSSGNQKRLVSELEKFFIRNSDEFFIQSRNVQKIFARLRNLKQKLTGEEKLGIKVGELKVGQVVAFGPVELRLIKTGPTFLLVDVATQKSYPLKIGENTVGRATRWSSVYLDNLAVSRQHAILHLDESGKVEVYNLYSRNKPRLLSRAEVRSDSSVRKLRLRLLDRKLPEADRVGASQRLIMMGKGNERERVLSVARGILAAWKADRKNVDELAFINAMGILGVLKDQISVPTLKELKEDPSNVKIRKLIEFNLGRILAASNLQAAFSQVLSTLDEEDQLKIATPRYGRNESFEIDSTVDAEKLKIVLSELINNALDHLESGKVQINVERNMGQMEIHIKNNGYVPRQELTDKAMGLAREGQLYWKKTPSEKGEFDVTKSIYSMDPETGYVRMTLNDVEHLEPKELLFIKGLSAGKSKDRGVRGGEGNGLYSSRKYMRAMGGDIDFIEQPPTAEQPASVSFFVLKIKVAQRAEVRGQHMAVKFQRRIREGLLGQEPDLGLLYDLAAELKAILYLSKDPDAMIWTLDHEWSTSFEVVALGERLGFKGRGLAALALGAAIHDIGKARIDPLVLNKTGALTPPESDEIRKHVDFGVAIFNDLLKILQTFSEHAQELAGKNDQEIFQWFQGQGLLEKFEQIQPQEFQNFLHDNLDRLKDPLAAQLLKDKEAVKQVQDMIAMHHETADGTGYPQGINNRSLPTQIMLIADRDDALRANRPYREAKSILEVEKMFTSGEGTLYLKEVLDAYREFHAGQILEETQKRSPRAGISALLSHMVGNRLTEIMGFSELLNRGNTSEGLLAELETSIAGFSGLINRFAPDDQTVFFRSKKNPSAFANPDTPVYGEEFGPWSENEKKEQTLDRAVLAEQADFARIYQELRNADLEFISALQSLKEAVQNNEAGQIKKLTERINNKGREVDDFLKKYKAEITTRAEVRAYSDQFSYKQKIVVPAELVEAYVPREIKVLFEVAERLDPRTTVLLTGGTARDLAVAVTTRSKLGFPKTTDYDLAIFFPEGTEKERNYHYETGYEQFRELLREALEGPEYPAGMAQRIIVDELPGTYVLNDDGKPAYVFENLLRTKTGNAFSVSRLGVEKVGSQYVIFGDEDAIRDLQEKKLNIWIREGIGLKWRMAAKMMGKAAIYHEAGGFEFTPESRDLMKAEIKDMVEEERKNSNFLAVLMGALFHHALFWSEDERTTLRRVESIIRTWQLDEAFGRTAVELLQLAEPSNRAEVRASRKGLEDAAKKIMQPALTAQEYLDQAEILRMGILSPKSDLRDIAFNSLRKVLEKNPHDYRAFNAAAHALTEIGTSDDLQLALRSIQILRETIAKSSIDSLASNSMFAALRTIVTARPDYFEGFDKRFGLNEADWKRLDEVLFNEIPPTRRDVIQKLNRLRQKLSGPDKKFSEKVIYKLSHGLVSRAEVRAKNKIPDQVRMSPQEENALTWILYDIGENHFRYSAKENGEVIFHIRFIQKTPSSRKQSPSGRLIIVTGDNGLGFQIEDRTDPDTGARIPGLKSQAQTQLSMLDQVEVLERLSSEAQKEELEKSESLKAAHNLFSDISIEDRQNVRKILQNFIETPNDENLSHYLFGLPPSIPRTIRVDVSEGTSASTGRGLSLLPYYLGKVGGKVELVGNRPGYVRIRHEFPISFKESPDRRRAKPFRKVAEEFKTQMAQKEGTFGKKADYKEQYLKEEGLDDPTRAEVRAVDPKYAEKYFEEFEGDVMKMSPRGEVILGNASRYPEYIEKVAPILFELIGKNANLLSLGPGTGELEVSLKDLGIKEVTAIELDKAFAQIVRNAGIVTHQGSIQEVLPTVKDESFNAVLISETIHWLDAGQTFKQAFRVLKPGGRVIIISRPPTDENSAVPDPRDPAQIEREIASAGFDLESLPKKEILAGDFAENADIRQLSMGWNIDISLPDETVITHIVSARKPLRAEVRKEKTEPVILPLARMNVIHNQGRAIMADLLGHQLHTDLGVVENALFIFNEYRNKGKLTDQNQTNLLKRMERAIGKASNFVDSIQNREFFFTQKAGQPYIATQRTDADKVNFRNLEKEEQDKASLNESEIAELDRQIGDLDSLVAILQSELSEVLKQINVSVDSSQGNLIDIKELGNRYQKFKDTLKTLTQTLQKPDFPIKRLTDEFGLTASAAASNVARAEVRRTPAGSRDAFRSELRLALNKTVLGPLENSKTGAEAAQQVLDLSPKTIEEGLPASMRPFVLPFLGRLIIGLYSGIRGLFLPELAYAAPATAPEDFAGAQGVVNTIQGIDRKVRMRFELPDLTGNANRSALRQQLIKTILETALINNLISVQIVANSIPERKELEGYLGRMQSRESQGRLKPGQIDVVSKDAHVNLNMDKTSFDVAVTGNPLLAVNQLQAASAFNAASYLGGAPISYFGEEAVEPAETFLAAVTSLSQKLVEGLIRHDNGVIEAKSRQIFNAFRALLQTAFLAEAAREAMARAA